jgi:hypothetical protein
MKIIPISRVENNCCGPGKYIGQSGKEKSYIIIPMNLLLTAFMGSGQFCYKPGKIKTSILN